MQQSKMLAEYKYQGVLSLVLSELEVHIICIRFIYSGGVTIGLDLLIIMCRCGIWEVNGSWSTYLYDACFVA